jgi:hypothetical protein
MSTDYFIRVTLLKHITPATPGQFCGGEAGAKLARVLAFVKPLCLMEIADYGV